MSNSSPNHGQAEGAAAAEPAEEPLSRRSSGSRKSGSGMSRRQAAAAKKGAAADGAQAPAAEARRPLSGREKRSVLKSLLGFLGKSQADKADKAADGAAAAAQPRWTPQEKLMIANIAELHRARVDDIMIPRSDIEALDLDKTLAEAMQLFEQSGHSRLPVYAETLDDPRGMIHIRDLLNYITRATLGAEAKPEDKGKNTGGRAEADKPFAALDLNKPIGKLGIIRDVLFVPASMPAGRLLTRMQAGRLQMALVIDEHGGTDGLVSMEDIVELIVGDIEDEHDEDDADFVKEAQDSWIIDAAAELEELQENLGIDFSGNPLSQEVDTIGGLIVMALDRIPARGEKGELMPNYLFQVLDADRRRIKRLRLIRTEAQPAGA